MGTDLDRLHWVVENRPRYTRRVGRTFASCHNLASLLETVPPGSVILYPLPKFGWLQHIRPMISEILAERKIPFEWTKRNRLEVFGRSVVFDCPWYLSYIPNHDYVVDTFGEYEEYRPQ